MFLYINWRFKKKKITVFTLADKKDVLIFNACLPQMTTSNLLVFSPFLLFKLSSKKTCCFASPIVQQLDTTPRSMQLLQYSIP